MRRELIPSSILLVVAICAANGCGKKVPPTSSEVVAMRVSTLPTTADDPVWKKAPICSREKSFWRAAVEPDEAKGSVSAEFAWAVLGGPKASGGIDLLKQRPLGGSGRGGRRYP